MPDVISPSPEPAISPARRIWPDYRTIWRWHFYAGLFSAPFVIFLSLTGAVYLFKPQVEAWQESPYDHLTLKGTSATPAAQMQAAVAAFPGSTPGTYELPPAPDASARISVRQNGRAIRVYVHPESLAVLHSIPEDERLMRLMFRLHGELGMGNRGSNLVEIAASWTILMLITGLYLWWPRGAKGLGGVLYPRLRKGMTIFWRDLHSVTGIWVSVLALFLLVTGLPWAKFWGTYFKEVRRVTGTAVAQQDWTVGSERAGQNAGTRAGGEHAGHAEHGGGGGSPGKRRGSGTPWDLASLNRVVATAETLNLPHPVLISGPAAGAKGWSVKSNTANRPQRVDLVIDGQTGAILRRTDFRDRHWIDRIVGYGIAAHEGQLFGWPNQLLGLLTVSGLMLLSGSGIVMWWRRREGGVLGAPRKLARSQWSWTVAAVVVLLGISLPLFAATLALVLAMEWLVLKRIVPVRNWLGLT